VGCAAGDNVKSVETVSRSTPTGIQPSYLIYRKRMKSEILLAFRCPPALPEHPVCLLTGDLSLHGEPHPFEVQMVQCVMQRLVGSERL